MASVLITSLFVQYLKRNLKEGRRSTMMLSGHESSGSRVLVFSREACCPGGIRGEESAGRSGGCHKMKDDVWIIVKI